jgi:hypothetical protein
MNVKFHSGRRRLVTAFIPAPGVIMMFMIIAVFDASRAEDPSQYEEKKGSQYVLCMFFHNKNFIQLPISKNPARIIRAKIRGFGA